MLKKAQIKNILGQKFWAAEFWVTFWFQNLLGQISHKKYQIQKKVPKEYWVNRITETKIEESKECWVQNICVTEFLVQYNLYTQFAF